MNKKAYFLMNIKTYEKTQIVYCFTLAAAQEYFDIMFPEKYDWMLFEVK